MKTSDETERELESVVTESKDFFRCCFLRDQLYIRAYLFFVLYSWTCLYLQSITFGATIPFVFCFFSHLHFFVFLPHCSK